MSTQHSKACCWERIGCENCIHRSTRHKDFDTERDIYTRPGGILERNAITWAERNKKKHSTQ